MQEHVCKEQSCACFSWVKPVQSLCHPSLNRKYCNSLIFFLMAVLAAGFALCSHWQFCCMHLGGAGLSLSCWNHRKDLFLGAKSSQTLPDPAWSSSFRGSVITAGTLIPWQSSSKTIEGYKPLEIDKVVSNVICKIEFPQRVSLTAGQQKIYNNINFLKPWSQSQWAPGIIICLKISLCCCSWCQTPRWVWHLLPCVLIRAQLDHLLIKESHHTPLATSKCAYSSTMERAGC